MDEKKLNKEDIINGLRCMAGQKACDLCKYNDLAEQREETCMNLVAEDAIELISEQKAEIERLTKKAEEAAFWENEYLEWATGFLKTRFDIKDWFTNPETQKTPCTYEFFASTLWEKIRPAMEWLDELKERNEALRKEKAELQKQVEEYRRKIKDKELIEEMAKDRVAELYLFYNFCKYNGCEEKTAEDCENCYFGKVYNRLAELEGKIRNGMLKKIPEGAVVISKEQNENWLSFLEQNIEKARKEAVEKFVELLLSEYAAFEEEDEILIKDMRGDIQDVAKAFIGGEYAEEKKET